MTTGDVTATPAPDEYLAQVRREIDDEARRRRRELPAGLERELDALFLEHAPTRSRYGDVEAALRMVDEAAFVDPVVPVASSLPGGSAVKKGLRSLSLWYVGYVTHQVSQVAAAVSRTLHLVDGHLQEIQRLLPPEVEPPVVEEGGPGAWWGARAADALGSVQGRVLHAACAGGWLVDALCARGLDAYGVDPRRGATASGPERLDLREEPVLDHLRAVSPGGLGGAVLSGMVEGLALHARGELVSLLGERLAAEAVVVVHSLTPAAWSADDGPVAADLSPGRPVRPGTWRELLGGWDVAVEAGPGGRDYLVVATRHDQPA